MQIPSELDIAAHSAERFLARVGAPAAVRQHRPLTTATRGIVRLLHASYYSNVTTNSLNNCSCRGRRGKWQRDREPRFLPDFAVHRDRPTMAFDPASGRFLGQLSNGHNPITIQGLWGLSFGCSQVYRCWNLSVLLQRAPPPGDGGLDHCPVAHAPQALDDSPSAPFTDRSSSTDRR